ncbi:MAG: ABC-F family ATP-binding cassette domain-containing protein [Candidatus Kaiserbacteria bacterium]|nr:ABC-F family ATP-binding cassette domain-containing protein [Candidatus Kaiserbacteria bacterium]
MLLSANAIEKQYGSHTVFESLSFTIDEGHKIALVGKNGAGKSTLMRILAGSEDPDSGSVTLTKGRVCAFAPQELVADEGRTGISYLNDLGLKEHQFIPILDGLGMSQAVVEQPIDSLSGGQRSKILLATFLLQPADILLMDEPTNNLDIPSLVWLETFLAASKKAMVIISHDLTFLNNVANRVFELKDGTLTSERGTYGDYLERKKKEHDRQMRQYREYQEQLQKLRKDRDDLKQKGERIDAVQTTDKDKFASGVNRDRASKGQQRVRSLDRNIRKLETVEKPYEEDEFALHISTGHVEGAVEVTVDDVVAGYPDGLSVGPLSLTLKQGERLCFMGENGSGKSTVLKTIIGALPPLQGSVTKTDAVQIGDFMQHHERADRSKDVLSFFIQETRSDRERAMHALKKVGFSDQTIVQTIDGISPGMRARLLFAVFVATGVTMLVLDEPTNHLDTEAVFALKDMLKDYQGIVLLVSHNRWFLENVAINQYFHIGDGTVDRIKDFEQYLRQAGDRAKGMTARLKRMIQ